MEPGTPSASIAGASRVKLFAVLLLLSPLLFALMVLAAPKYDGTVENPRFDFATTATRSTVKLCIGNLDNCRIMYRRGMHGHTPLFQACEIANRVYVFCKPKHVSVLPTPRSAEAL